MKRMCFKVGALTFCRLGISSNTILSTIWKSPEISRNIHKSPEISRKLQKIPENLQKFPENSRKFQKIPENSRKFQKSPEIVVDDFVNQMALGKTTSWQNEKAP